MAARCSSVRLVLVVGVVCFAVGCGDNYGNRQEVSGTIQLKGAPLAEGVIEFHPLTQPGSAGSATKSGTVISAGKYTIPRKEGLVPGKYRVLITAGDGKTPTDADAMPGPTGNFVSKELIPPEYNEASKEQVEVKAGGPNVFNYTIP